MITAEELVEHERRLVSTLAAGGPVDLRVGDPRHDDPACGDTWDDPHDTC